jgi:hypothetical protein
VTDYIWPSALVPSSSEWRLVANTAAFTSPLSGTTRTLARGGDRWACTLTFNNLRDSQRAILQAFLAQLRGQANRVYLRDHAYRRRGSFATSELLPDFSSATPWTTGYATLTVTDGVGRITATSHTGSQYPGITKTATGVNGALYALRAFYTRSSTGSASLGPFLTDGSTSTSSYSTAAGLKTVSLLAASTSLSASVIIDGTGTSTATGDFADVPYASLSRCVRVNGANQTGSSLTIGATGTYQAALLAGDRIEVNGECNMVADTTDFETTGRIRLVRPLRSSPADNAPIIINDPLCRMMLADNTVSWSNAPGRFSSFTVEFVEDLL